MIPRRLVRTVPAKVDPDTELLWGIACGLHPDWEHVTWRDPIDQAAFPITSPYWQDCETGAQLADLVRAEDLYHSGGIYLDSDFHCFKSFEPFVGLNGFAAFEDRNYIPNAVMGFRPGHPALREVLDQAIAKRHRGTWTAGVGVTNEVFRHHKDILLMPPGMFYAVHWRDAHRHGIDIDRVRSNNPWAVGIHLYKASWHADK